jgi:hypothetical protein
MRAVMVVVVTVILGVSVSGCEKHIKEVRGGNADVVVSAD